MGCYGSEIPTPHLDAPAARGLRLTDYHATPMCSPTRASLLTGVNPHAAGVGTVAHSDPGFPGYAMEIAADVATAGEILRAAGWTTAMVESIDASTGRLVAALEAMGQLDDTIVIFTSDNGASREGEVDGTASYYVHLMAEIDLEVDLARIDEMGGPTTTPHYPRGWAMAGNTPFRLYKINAHAGGHQVPMIIAGPTPGGAGEMRRQGGTPSGSTARAFTPLTTTDAAACGP